jgi:hypothetical protein
VRLVDHDQPRRCGEAGQHLVAELRIVQTFRTDEQHVHRAGAHGGVDLLPLLGIGRVDRARMDASPRGGFDLVAHQCEQRRDDDCRPGTPGAEQRGRDEIHRRLAPSGALHHEHAAPVCGERADRGPLVLAQSRLSPGQRLQVARRLEAQGRLVHIVHALIRVRGRQTVTIPTLVVCHQRLRRGAVRGDKSVHQGRWVSGPI